MKKNKCLSCKKEINGIGVIFYGKYSCYNCHNEFMNNPNIIHGSYKH